MANSGYSETTKTALYNTYQKNVTDTLNNARDLKSDYDFKIAQARQQGSVQQAQAAVDLYAQRLQLLTQNYELRQNREQYLYQKERDKVSDNQWQKTFDEQVRQNEIENQWKQKNYDYQQQRDSVSDSQWKQSFDYQKQRDAVSDSQWQKQYELSKKASASRTSSSSKSTSKSSSKKSSSSEGLKVASEQVNVPEAKEVISKMTILQQPGNQGAVRDGISGKTFSSVDELLNYYGYVGVN